MFEVVVEASNKISLGGGKTSHGFVVTTKHGTSKTGGNVFCVALTEGNPVVGTFAIRGKADLVTKDGVLTFADVTLKDGKQLPVSVRLEPKQTARANEELIGEEIQRIARNIKVIADGENAPKPLPLLKGPLLRHRSLGNYACGTVWGWGEPGRPEALLSLSLTGPPAAPYGATRWFPFRHAPSSPRPARRPGGLPRPALGAPRRYPTPPLQPKMPTSGSVK